MAIALPDVFTLGHSPDPDDAFMFYALAAGQDRHARLPVRAHPPGHRDAQPARDARRTAPFGHLHRRGRLRARQICAAAQRREHGRRLRPDGRRRRQPPCRCPTPCARATRKRSMRGCDGKRIAIPGEEDERVSVAAALQARFRLRRRAVRPDFRRRARTGAPTRASSSTRGS